MQPPFSFGTPTNATSDLSSPMGPLQVRRARIKSTPKRIAFSPESKDLTPSPLVLTTAQTATFVANNTNCASNVVIETSKDVRDMLSQLSEKDEEGQQDVKVIIQTPASLKKHKISQDVEKQFNWDEYLQQTGAEPAPTEAFMQTKDFSFLDNKFSPNMKLEAKDPRNPTAWCLGTVRSVEGPRIQIRFDGSGTSNDFWALIDSSDLRYVNAKPGELLNPPVSFVNSFCNYNKFVQKQLSKPDVVLAPESCFIQSPQRPVRNFFQTGMKLEAVDRKNPSLICPATVGKIDGINIEIKFDGYKGSVDYMCNYFSRDIFPINYCLNTRAYLTPPPNWNTISPNNSQPRIVPQTITKNSSKLPKKSPPKISPPKKASSKINDSHEQELNIKTPQMHTCQRHISYQDWFITEKFKLCPEAMFWNGKRFQIVAKESDSYQFVSQKIAMPRSSISETILQTPRKIQKTSEMRGARYNNTDDNQNSTQLDQTNDVTSTKQNIQSAIAAALAAARAAEAAADAARAAADALARAAAAAAVAVAESVG